MKIKKTWFSYVLWVIFSIILFASVGVSAVGISQKGSLLEYLPGIGFFYAVFVLGAAAMIGILILYNKFMKDKMDFSELQGIKLIEIFSVIILILIAITIRVFVLITNLDSFLGTDKYFNLATGIDSSISAAALTNGEVFYINVLKFIFGFLGAKPLAAMGLQILFHLITLALLYPMVKWALGAMSAWISIILFAFLPGSFTAIAHVTPDCLLVCLIVGFLFLLSLINHMAVKNKIISPLQIGFFILLGGFGGLITYFDIIGIAFILISVFSFFSIRSDDKDLAVQKPLIQFIIFLASYLIVLALSIYFLSGILRGGLSAFLFFVKQFIPESGISFTLLNPHSGNYDALALYALAGVWFVAFLRSKLDRGFPYVCLIVFSTIYVFFGMKTGNYSSLCSVFWILLAATGFTSADAFSEQEYVPKKVPVAKTFKEKKKSKEPEIKKEPIKFAKASDIKDVTPLVPASASSNNVEISNGVEVQKVPKPPKPDGSSSETATSTNKEERVSAVPRSAPVPPKSTAATPVPELPKSGMTAPTPTVSQEVPKTPATTVVPAAPKTPVVPAPAQKPVTPPPKPRMLKNPLPEPKPHVSKEMNYDYFPKPSEMHYDITDMRGKEYYDV